MCIFSGNGRGRKRGAAPDRQEDPGDPASDPLSGVQLASEAGGVRPKRNRHPPDWYQAEVPPLKPSASCRSIANRINRNHRELAWLGKRLGTVEEDMSRVLHALNMGETPREGLKLKTIFDFYFRLFLVDFFA